ncbi:MAG: hypothetical protein COX63_01690 [Candidatus Diapherotrites archaeon CG_4_10_14_0_2_um_filter_31_5]|nr:MAG: hypothetical protein COX63_01690 [Candidatus Diapherotrites archaeon CG_4_10_14_0_2_um_filter_31_5]
MFCFNSFKFAGFVLINFGARIKSFNSISFACFSRIFPFSFNKRNLCSKVVLISEPLEKVSLISFSFVFSFHT